MTKPSDKTGRVSEEALNKAIESLRGSAAEAARVLTQEEADQLNASGFYDHTWSVGDKYYTFSIHKKWLPDLMEMYNDKTI